MQEIGTGRKDKLFIEQGMNDEQQKVKSASLPTLQMSTGAAASRRVMTGMFIAALEATVVGTAMPK